MPEIIIDGKTKHFAYTKAGYRAAAKFRKKSSGKNYSSEHVKMARGMMR